MKRLSLIFLSVLIMSAISLVAAQPTDETTTLTHASFMTGMTLTYPADWYAIESTNDNGIITFTDSRNTLETVDPNTPMTAGSFTMTLYAHQTVSQLGAELETIQDMLLQALTPEIADFFEEPINTEIGDKSAIIITYDDPHSSGMIIVFDVGQSLSYAVIDTHPGELDTLQDDVFATIESASLIEYDDTDLPVLSDATTIDDLNLAINHPQGWIVEFSDQTESYVIGVNPSGVDETIQNREFFALLQPIDITGLNADNPETITIEQIVSAFASPDDQIQAGEIGGVPMALGKNPQSGLAYLVTRLNDETAIAFLTIFQDQLAVERYGSALQQIAISLQPHTSTP